MRGKLQTYEFLDEFVLRTPLFPFHKDVDEAYVNDMLSCALFREAVFLASPDSYRAIIDHQDLVKDERDQSTLYKYAVRNSINCASFGISGGVSVGKFSNEASSILISPASKIKRKIKLNTHIGKNFPASVLSDDPVKYQLQYYFNPSYCIVNDLVKYLKQHDRRYTIVVLKYTELIAYLISMTKYGIVLQELRDDLMAQLEVPQASVEAYLDKLIQNQVLLSEFRFKPSTEKVHIEAMLDRLSKSSNATKATEWKELLQKLSSANEQNLSTIPLEKSVREALAVTTKEVFHVEMERPAQQVNLNNKLRKELRSVIHFLNDFLPNVHQSLLHEFKAKFVEKYGTEKLVPLMLALDRDYGIGFESYHQSHPLVKPIKAQAKEIKEIQEFDQFLGALLLKATTEGLYSIELSDQDVPSFNTLGESILPASMYISFEVIQAGEQTQLVFKSAAGSSAANIISRYSVCEELEALTKKIIDKEAKIYQDAIVAEMLHVPPLDKSLNVICRKSNRQYEIPVTAISEKEKEYVIPLTDIYVAIVKNRFVLYSKKLAKEIIPRLTTMHSFLNSNYLYKFLASLQFDYRRESVSFNWRDYTFIGEFFPRLSYRGVIFSPAQWRFKSKSVLSALIQKDFEQTKKQVQRWRKQHKIPDCIFLRRTSGNNLFINFSSDLSIKVFLKEAKKSHHFLMIESFFKEDNLLVKDEEGQVYINQCIGFMVQNKVQKSNCSFDLARKAERRYEKKFVLKVNCVERNLWKVLQQLYRQVQHETQEKLLFYFQLEEQQLLFTFKYKKYKKYKKSFSALTELLDRLFEEKMILQYSVHPLELTESTILSESIQDQIFSFESKFALSLLEQTQGSNAAGREDAKLLFLMKSFDHFLDLFARELKDKLQLIQLLIRKAKAYRLAYRLKEVNSLYQNYETRVNRFFHQTIDGFDKLLGERASLYKSILNAKYFEKPQEHMGALHFILSNTINRLFFADAQKFELVVYCFLKNYLQYQLYHKSNS